MTGDFVAPLSYTPEQWIDILYPLSDNNIKTARYRSAQICEWIYRRQISDYKMMSNLPKHLRDELAATHPIRIPVIKERKISSDGTVKFLLEVADGNLIEMVIIPEKVKRTLCISSQVGCIRRCSFCATGNIGFRRNLSAGEIVSQIFIAMRDISGTRITNLVFMGMGEPLDNHLNVFRSIRLIQHERTFSFSPRRSTLSTCGIVPGLKKLLAEKIKIKLAVSLNSAIQEKREVLMPVARLYPLSELKPALLLYRRNNPFRITIEYVMFKGFNTGREDAQALIKLLGDLSCKVNLISWNEVTDCSEFQTPSQNEVEEFIQYLQPFRFAVTYRKSRGQDIHAACGQLAACSKRPS